MTTILTLAGLGGSYDLNNFGGELFNGVEVAVLKYPNSAALNSNAAKGVTAIDSALHSIAGDVWIVGHSMGAQVIYKWLREKGPNSNIDPTRVRFYSSGNPERKYGGAAIVYPRRHPPAYGGPGLPADTRYTVIDIARQYDYWADYPLRYATVPDAVSNASMAIHGQYEDCRISDPRNASFTEGNVTYITTYTEPACPLANKWYLFGKSAKVSRDQSIRPKIESAYDRPAPFHLVAA